MNGLARRWLVAALTVLIVQGVLTLVALPSLLEGELVDTDTYMHLVRARELLEGESFFNPVIERSNVPYGETQHWTRLCDLVLIALALPVSFRGLDSALNFAALAMGPVMLLFLIVAFEWASRPFRRSADWPLVVVVGASQAAVLSYSAVGRADHHILILLAMTLTIGLLLRVVSATERSNKDVWLGASMAAGLWVSTEFIVVIGVGLLSLAITWIQRGHEFASTARRVPGYLAVGMMLAVVLERGPNWRTIEYDRISLVHVGLALAAYIAFVVSSWLVSASGSLRRTLAMAGIGSAALLLVQQVFPDVFRGPWANIDPKVSEIWLDRVAELQPMFPTSLEGLGVAIMYLGAPGMGLGFGIAMLFRAQRGSSPIAVPLTIGTATFVILALRYSRFAPHAEIFGAFLLVWGIDVVLARSSQRQPFLRALFRVSVVGAACAGWLVVGASLSGYRETATTASPTQTCNVRELAEFLDDPRRVESQLTILANIDFGSELLYRTDHRVIGTPIRQQDAILDTYSAFTTTDPGRTLTIVSEREVNAVLLCPSRDSYMFGDPPPSGSLDEQLLRGELPSWLVTVELPAHLAGFRLFEVRA